MTTFGEVIANETTKTGDKKKIIAVMKYTLNKKETDTITPAMIEKVKTELGDLDVSKAANSWEANSIAGWADKYKTFINYAAKKGGKKKRKRTRKRTRKRRRKRRTKKQKGGVLLLGAYAAYKYFTNNKKKRRRRKTKKTVN